MSWFFTKPFLHFFEIYPQNYFKLMSDTLLIFLWPISAVRSFTEASVSSMNEELAISAGIGKLSATEVINICDHFL